MTVADTGLYYPWLKLEYQNDPIQVGIIYTQCQVREQKQSISTEHQHLLDLWPVY